MHLFLGRPLLECPSRVEMAVYTYRSRFTPEGVAEASQIFLRDAHVLPKSLSYEEYYTRTTSISGVSAINPLVAFYDMYECFCH
jgi:hypothetical protein